MMQIAICDDDVRCLSYIKNNVEAYGLKNKWNIHFSSFSSAEEFLRGYSDIKYDLVFLDVEMGGMDGISLSKRIWEKDKNTAIVFVTGHVKYSLEAFDSHAFHYLLKPIDGEKIHKVLDDYFECFNEDAPFFEHGNVKVKLDDILYIESTHNNKINIITYQGKIENYETLKNMKTRLDDRFVQCHKGFIVNVSKVQYQKKEDKIAGHNFVLPIGRKYKEEFIKAHMEYVKKSWRYKG